MKKENNKIYKPLTLDKKMNPYVLLERIATRWIAYIDALPKGKTYDCSSWGYPLFDDVRWEDSSVWLVPSMFYKTGTKNIHLLPACMIVRSDSSSNVCSEYTSGYVAGAVSDLYNYKWGDPLTIKSDMCAGDYVKFTDIVITQHCFSPVYYAAPVRFYSNWKLLSALPFNYAIPIKGDNVGDKLDIFDHESYEAIHAYILGGLIYQLTLLYNKNIINSHA